MLAPKRSWLVAEAAGANGARDELRQRKNALRRAKVLRRQLRGGSRKHATPKSQPVRVVAPERPRVGLGYERALDKALGAFPDLRYAAYAPAPMAWADLPAEVDVACGVGGGALPAARRARKREQLSNMLSLLGAVARPGDTIVDFCCGLGHQTLPLAYLRRDVNFVLVDMNPFGLGVAAQRCQALGLENVTTFRGWLRDFRQPFDVGVALHACGAATDDVLEKCVEQRAAFVVAPCCVGGVAKAEAWRDVVTEGPGARVYPRSQALRAYISRGDYVSLARAADTNADAGRVAAWQADAAPASRGPVSRLQNPGAPIMGAGDEDWGKARIVALLKFAKRHLGYRCPPGQGCIPHEAERRVLVLAAGPADAPEARAIRDDLRNYRDRNLEACRKYAAQGRGVTTGCPDRRRLCKTVVEMDRLLGVTEAGGYAARLVLMEPLSCTPKNDIIVGWRAEDGRGAFLLGAADRTPPWIPAAIPAAPQLGVED